MTSETTPPSPAEKGVYPINVAEEMSQSFLDYSMSVIISRALPDARDGLKPSQRRLLYAMHHDLSLTPTKKHLKCARIVGETMGKYHPHGDGAIYPTLVNMAQPWSMRDTLVDGQGNFGSVEGDPPAAMRYTEARLTHCGSILMTDLEKDTVDFVPNYDESNREPSVLPAAIPNLLVNGGTGIAVGMATNIPPHNLGEVVDGICATIDDPDISVADLLTFIKGPDFPSGCTIMGLQGIHEYTRTGRGSVKVRGKAEIHEDERGREQIIITEIPYAVNRAKLVERIAELANEKIIPEISAVRDESDENTRVVVDLKRDARAQVVLNNLYKHTALASSFAVNMLAIDQRRPRLLNLKEAIQCYIEHRREVILRRTRFLLNKAEEQAEKLEAFLLALGNLDDFIRIIRDSRTRDEAREKIKAYPFSAEAAEGLGILLRGQESLQTVPGRYVLTDRQVDHILELRLYQLVGLEREKIKADYDTLLETIKDLLDILAREERVLQIIKDELQDVKARYGTPRRTNFAAAEEGEIANVDLIADEAFMITITHRGNIKRTIATEYRTQDRGGKGLKGMETREAADEDEVSDFVESLYTATAHDYLMFFTDTGRVYVERVFNLPEGARTAKGRSIKNLLNLRPEEKVASVLRIEAHGNEDKDVTFSRDRFVLFGTRSGKVKKTRLSDFRNYRKDGIIAIRIEEGNSLTHVVLTDGTNDISMVTNRGYAVRCNESTIRPMGRSSAGVRGIRPRPGDYLVGLTVVDEQCHLLVISENGIGKRTPFSDYPTKGRGGKGVITMRVTEKTGPVAAALRVSEEDELMMMDGKGQSSRIRVSRVRVTGRNASGVILMRIAEGEKIQDISLVVPDGDEDEEDSEISDLPEAEPDDEIIDETDEDQDDDLDESDTEEEEE